MSQTGNFRLETIDTMLARNKVPSIGGRWINLKKEEDATPVDRAVEPLHIPSTVAVPL
jgi:hypothetical protein